MPVEVVAWGTPDGQALVRLDDREFSVQRRDAPERLAHGGAVPRRDGARLFGGLNGADHGRGRGRQGDEEGRLQVRVRMLAFVHEGDGADFRE